jgi:hypothetical protein
MADPKKQGEKADQMIAEQNRLRAEAAATMAAKATADLETPPTTSDAIPAAEDADKPDVSAQAPASPKEANPELDALREQVRVADQRWNVLQGMVKKKDSEIEQMRVLLSQINLKKEEQPAPAPVQSPAVTTQDVEDFGQDMIDLITKIATVVAQSAVKNAGGQFETRVTELKQSVDSISEATARTAAEMFNDALTKQVPNWKQVNVDPAFLVWLDEVDGFTGATRLELLTDAYTKMNLVRTAKFFEKFLEETKPEAAPLVVVPPVADASKLVTPGKSRTAAPTQAPANDKMWTPEAIQKLYSDQRTGKITKEEFDKQERDLFKAQRENRIAA